MMARRRRVSGLTLLVALVAACGQAAPSPNAPTPTPASPRPTATLEPSASVAPAETPSPTPQPVTEPPTLAPTTPSPSPTPARVDGAFGRRDVPPGGVADSLPYGIPNLRACVLRADGDPSGWVWLSRIADSIPTYLCATGFDASQPIEFSLAGPDGQLRSKDVMSPWRLDAVSDPFQGPYRLRAAQGERFVERDEVWISSDDGVVAFPPAARRGENVEVAVALPSAPGLHPAFLYRAGADSNGITRWFFAVDLGTIDVDGTGEGRLTLTSSAADEAGGYAVWVDGHLGAFRLE